MADLTEAQKESYWRYNIRLTTILLIIWFVVTYLVSGLWAGWLNQFSFLGFPLGYYMAAQVAGDLRHRDRRVRAYLMNKKDIEYGIREEGSIMSLAKIFGFIRSDSRGSRSSSASPRYYLDCRTLGLAGSSWRCLWASTLSLGSSRGPRILTSIMWRVAGCHRYSTAWPPAQTGCRQRPLSPWRALSAQGFAGLAYVMGWTGGYLLLAVFLGPYLRQFGAYTIPDFLGARYGGNFARVIGVIAAIVCSFTYLIAQVTGVGLIVARFIGIDYNIGVFVGLIGVLFCSVLGA